MQLTIRSRTETYDVDLSVVASDVTIGELVTTQTGVVAPSQLFVDGITVSADEPISSAVTVRGAVVSTVRSKESGNTRPVLSLWQCGGIDAGWCQPLSEGRYQLAELAADNGTTVDANVAIADLTILANGTVTLNANIAGLMLDDQVIEGEVTWDDQILIAAGRAFRVGPPPLPPTRLQAARNGCRPVNRPARPLPQRSNNPLELPEIETPETKPRKLPIITMIAPLPVAVIMSFFMGPRAMVFGLLSPIMAIGSWAEDRRQHKQSKTLRERQIRDATQIISEQINERAATDRFHRRHDQPDLGEIGDRARQRMSTLWERRPIHDDAYCVSLGLVDIPVDLQVNSKPGKDPVSQTANDLLRQSGWASMVPSVVSLLQERGIGVVGSPDATSAVIRALIMQLVVLHGPADVGVSVFTSLNGAADHDWIKWLPHALDDGRVDVHIDRESAINGVKSIRATLTEHDKQPFAQAKQAIKRMQFIVVDDLRHVHGRDAALAPLLASGGTQLRFIVASEVASDLPDACTTVLTLKRVRSRTDGGRAANAPVIGEVTVPARRFTQENIIVYGLNEEVAADLARRLACLEDPEHLTGAGSSVPDYVNLRPLLGLEPAAAASGDLIGHAKQAAITAIQQSWTGYQRRVARAIIGVGADGPVIVDLVNDGPHGLIAGTTGAGKSELLRTLVVSLAVSMPPDQLNFVLVDYKGGSAFDACSELPHSVAMVTDLDEHLSKRVLRSLSAELKFREHRLRELGATDIDDVLNSAQRKGERSPLARLVVVVDEFATLAAELPEFVQSLVDVAQRGRSLGIHMILATQRPAGVVDAKIKANTNLRIALRVQDDTDSIDVIGTKVAANIDRRVPGRGVIRLGASELVDFQTAHATAIARGDRPSERLVARRYSAVPKTAAIDQLSTGNTANSTQNNTVAETVGANTQTDLDIVVGAARSVFTEMDLAPARIPFQDPLPNVLRIEDMSRRSREQIANAIPSQTKPRNNFEIPIGVIDEPEQQRQSIFAIDISTRGSLLAYGISGSGTTSLLTTIAFSAAGRLRPDQLFLYAIDADTNDLSVIKDWPHTGAVAGLDDLPFVARVIRTIAEELDRRRLNRGGANKANPDATTLLLIDNFGALRQSLQDDPIQEKLLGVIESIVRDGPSFGIHTLITAKQERAIPSALASLIDQRFIFRLAEATAYSSFGIRQSDVPNLTSGRCLISSHNMGEVQLVLPRPADLQRVLSVPQPDAGKGAPRVPNVPNTVTSMVVNQALAGRRFNTEPGSFAVPIGLSIETGDAVALILRPGEHALIVGPARTGRSSLARRLVQRVHTDFPDVPIAILNTRPGPLAEEISGTVLVSEPDEINAFVDIILNTKRRRIVVIDDADRLSSPGLERLAAARDDLLSIVAIGRPDGMRGFGFWGKNLGNSRNGVITKPTQGDGELLRVSLPSRMPRIGNATGVLVDDGDIRIVQLIDDSQDE